MAQRGERQCRSSPGRRGRTKEAFRKGLRSGGEKVNVKSRTRGSVPPTPPRAGAPTMTDRLREGVQTLRHQVSACWEQGPGVGWEAGVCRDISLDGSHRGEREAREE